MLRTGLSTLAAAALMGWPLILEPAPMPSGQVPGTKAASEHSPVPLGPTAPPRTDYPAHLRPLGTPAPVRRAPAGEPRELILTFDDGPDLFGTPLVLAELERRGLKGIFFVNGEHMVGRRPQDFARRDLIRKVAAHGHLVANHTLSHANVCGDAELMEAEIDGNAEIITAATGVRPLLFRAPYGARCRRLDSALAARELLQVGWNLDPQEWKGGDEDAIVEHVTSGLRRLRGRSILLLHDTKREAVRALPRILDWIERENHRAARSGEPTIRIRDYSALLPPVPLPEHGLEPFWRVLADSVRLPLAATAHAVATARR